MTYPTIKRIIRSHASSDGDGVRIQRVALFNESISDPFLMIDELRSVNPDDYIGGFPPHPHRGMETLTYLIQGALEHQDHLGNRGMIHSGGAQWMSAGRGIIHSEMPSLEERGLHGFQLWINLPARDKMKAPDYRDVPKEEIPSVHGDGWKANVIGGHWLLDDQEVNGPLMHLAASAAIIDIELTAGASISVASDPELSRMAFVYEGSINLEKAHPERALLVFQDSQTLALSSAKGARLLLLAGKPIKEKVVHYGPFVMNSVQEIEQAIQDYQSGKFGRG